MLQVDSVVSKCMWRIERVLATAKVGIAQSVAKA